MARHKEELPQTSEEMENTLALTRKFLEGMGIEDKQVESIIEAHSETVTALKAERDKAREDAKTVPDLQRQLEEAKAASGDDGEWEQKYNDEHQAFEDFKAQVATEKADAEKAQAYRGMLMSAGIDPKRIDAIMRVTDLSGVEMEDGKLKDAGKLEESAREEWADFVIKEKTLGSKPATPPKHGNVPEGASEIAKQVIRERQEMYGNKTEED